MSKEDVQNDTALLVPEFQVIVSDIMNLVTIKFWLPFQIFETLRTQERQQWLFDQGYSKTLKSNHATGRAMDLVVFIGGKYSWADEHIPLYNQMGALVKEKFGDKVTWGGDWAMRDLPHIEMK